MIIFFHILPDIHHKDVMPGFVSEFPMILHRLCYGKPYTPLISLSDALSQESDVSPCIQAEHFLLSALSLLLFPLIFQISDKFQLHHQALCVHSVCLS